MSSWGCAAATAELGELVGENGDIGSGGGSCTAQELQMLIKYLSSYEIEGKCVVMGFREKHPLRKERKEGSTVSYR